MFPLRLGEFQTSSHRCSLPCFVEHCIGPLSNGVCSGQRFVSWVRPGLALAGLHPGVFLVDDEGAAAAADNLCSGYFFQCPQ
jgi:hypothetical protein